MAATARRNIFVLFSYIICWFLHPSLFFEHRGKSCLVLFTFPDTKITASMAVLKHYCEHRTKNKDYNIFYIHRGTHTHTYATAKRKKDIFNSISSQRAYSVTIPQVGHFSNLTFGIHFLSILLEKFYLEMFLS